MPQSVHLCTDFREMRADRQGLRRRSCPRKFYRDGSSFAIILAVPPSGAAPIRAQARAILDTGRGTAELHKHPLPV